MLGGENRIKQQVREGKTVLGFVCRTLSPTLVELIGLAGFDFVWLDMEHTGANLTTIEHLCRAADATNIESLVRVPENNSSDITRVLEVGAAIVNVPQINDRAEAEAVVRAAKYAPLGERGFCSSSRGNSYGFAGNAKLTFAAANERTMTMVQIESVRGVENVDEICMVKGLDAVFVGLADLSQSLGVSGELDHPKVLEAARKVLAATRASGKVSAMLVETSEDAERWIAEGVQIISCGVDINLIAKTLRRIREDFESFPS